MDIINHSNIRKYIKRYTRTIENALLATKSRRPFIIPKVNNKKRLNPHHYQKYNS